METFLDLLFKCKPLFKAFVWLDYVVRYREIPKSIELTDSREHIIVIDKGTALMLAFYIKGFFHHEIVDDSIVR